MEIRSKVAEQSRIRSRATFVSDQCEHGLTELHCLTAEKHVGYHFALCQDRTKLQIRWQIRQFIYIYISSCLDNCLSGAQVLLSFASYLKKIHLARIPFYILLAECEYYTVNS